jgi:hypothetical protein
MTEDHELRPECAREFGRIQAAEEAAREFRAEVRNSLGDIKDDVADMKEMLANHVGVATSVVDRIEAAEEDIDIINDRMWRERVISAGGAGGVFALLSWLIERLGG